MENKNVLTLTFTLLATINSLLIATHTYHLTNNGLQNLDTIVSWGFNVFGVVISHQKSFKDYFRKGQ